MSQGSQPLLQPSKRLKTNHNNKVTHKVTRCLQRDIEEATASQRKIACQWNWYFLKVEVMK